MKTEWLLKTKDNKLRIDSSKVPKKNEVHHFLNEMLAYLFPILSENESDEEKDIDNILKELETIIEPFDYKASDVNLIIDSFKKAIPGVYELLVSDAVATYQGDPAAKSIAEVIMCYPGFYAIAVYRIAHELDKLSVSLIPRILTEYSHSKTGIDIHASADIGKSFCIDHGTGIVIGETSQIGASVKIYQGVTLGALSVSKGFSGKKRHPTIENNTVIYAGSTILGGKTVIGHDSIIGGNVWLTRSVDSNSVVLNQSKVHLKNNVLEGNEVIDFVI